MANLMGAAVNAFSLKLLGNEVPLQQSFCRFFVSV